MRRLYASTNSELTERLKTVFTNSARNQRPMSVVAVKTTHPIHKNLIGKAIYHVLSVTNHRVTMDDFVIVQNQGDAYFVGVGYAEDNLSRFTKELDEHLKSRRLRAVGPVTYTLCGKDPSDSSKEAITTLSSSLESLMNGEKLRVTKYYEERGRAAFSSKHLQTYSA